MKEYKFNFKKNEILGYATVFLYVLSFLILNNKLIKISFIVIGLLIFYFKRHNFKLINKIILIDENYIKFEFKSFLKDPVTFNYDDIYVNIDKNKMYVHSFETSKLLCFINGNYLDDKTQWEEIVHLFKNKCR